MRLLEKPILTKDGIISVKEIHNAFAVSVKFLV